MYDGVQNTQKNLLKAPCEPVFITTQYACITEINENVQNVSRDSERKSIYGLTRTSPYCRILQKKKKKNPSKLSLSKRFSSVPHQI
jgi:hypothetical protein